MAQDDTQDQSIPRDVGNTNMQNPQGMATEMAKAFQELARGEQTASALEKQLDGIESRIEELLAAAEAAASQYEMNSSTAGNGATPNATAE